jgi:Family of unknown function (DUF5336)
MSYPSGHPGGYPGPPPQQGAPVFGQPPAPPNPLGSLGIPGLLTLAVFVLGLVSYFCSFGGGAGIEVLVLLAGGLLAALDLLPKAPRVLPFATVLSVVGGLGVLAVVVTAGSVPTTEILILVFGLLQAVASVAALLLAFEVIRLAPKQAVPHAPAYPPSGAFPQQQPPPHQGGHQPPPGGPATTKYANPVPPPPQSTQFLQQPGKLSNPPGSE